MNLERTVSRQSFALQEAAYERKWLYENQALATDQKISSLHDQIGQNHRRIGHAELASGLISLLGTSLVVTLGYQDNKIADAALNGIKTLSSFWQQQEQKSMTISQGTASQEQQKYGEHMRKASDENTIRAMQQLREAIHSNESRKGIH
ncbi:MAG: hypothetical protein JW769_03280 [Parachlamydiales bacterium]|nr:hypothetical protein [Parachlamydiales bacterium]